MNNIKIIRKLIVILIAVSIITLTFGLYHQEQCLAKENDSYQGKAFSLYKKVIGGSEFQSYIDLANKMANQYGEFGVEFREPEIWDYALTMAVNDSALKQEMSKYGSEITVTNEEAEALIDKYCPTEEEVETLMGLNDFKNKGALIDAVVQEMEYEKFLISKAREFKIEVTEAEVRAELEQIKVRHILIGFNDSDGKTQRTPEQASARADEVYRKIIEGADFQQLAGEYSDDPGSREMGGDLGPMSLAIFTRTMISEFVEGALALREGEISKPVKSQFGYHIIRMDQRGIPEGDEYTAKYKEVEDGLLVAKVKESPEMKEWTDQLFEAASMQMTILDPALLAYRLSNQEEWAEAAKSYQKAIKTKYYAKKWVVYLDAANAYLMLEQPAKALKVLKKVALEAQDSSEYQDMLQRAQNFE